MPFIKLEEEGLLEPLPTAGFKARSFSEDDIKDAIDSRGMVEGAAARKITIGYYIDGFYNLQRRHSALGYKSPLTFEAEMTMM